MGEGPVAAADPRTTRRYYRQRFLTRNKPHGQATDAISSTQPLDCNLFYINSQYSQTVIFFWYNRKNYKGGL